MQAVSFKWAHRKKISTGDKSIPPPIPMRPEINPMAAPIPNVAYGLKGRIGLSAC